MSKPKRCVRRVATAGEAVDGQHKRDSLV